MIKSDFSGFVNSEDAARDFKEAAHIVLDKCFIELQNHIEQMMNSSDRFKQFMTPGMTFKVNVEVSHSTTNTGSKSDPKFTCGIEAIV